MHAVRGYRVVGRGSSPVSTVARGRTRSEHAMESPASLSISTPLIQNCPTADPKSRLLSPGPRFVAQSVTSK
jgi:hypothetical protein